MIFFQLFFLLNNMNYHFLKIFYKNTKTKYEIKGSYQMKKKFSVIKFNKLLYFCKQIKKSQ